MRVGLDFDAGRFWSRCGSILVLVLVFGRPLLSVNGAEVKSAPPLLSQWSIGAEMNILTV